MSPCATIQGAIGKAQAGDLIYVATGTYTSNEAKVVIINKNITLSGGWDGSFLNQNGSSIIDGQNAHQGIRIDSGVSAQIDHFTVQHGFADGYVDSYGGILNSGSLVLSHSTVQHNQCVEGCWAGGIFNYFATLTIQDSTILDNQSTRGGGITNYGTGVSQLTVINSLISQNRSDYGAGIYNGGNLTLVNSTISQNQANAGGTGGGIYNWEGSLSIYNSTITQNEGKASSGGIFFYNPFGGNAILENSILSGNTADTYPDCYGPIGSGGYNIIGDTTGCSFVPAASDLLNVDPRLGPLQNNGGPTYTHWLYSDSPAIDGANPDGCRDQTGNLLHSDQRGYTRPLDGDSDGLNICDIGAFEADPNNLPPPPPQTLWYVTPNGNDNNNCHTPANPCKTMNGAITKAAAGDTVYVSEGIYTAPGGHEVVLINKNLNLYGGWNAGFTEQNGLSTIDGGSIHRGVTIGDQIRVNISNVNIQNGFISDGDGGGIYIGYRSRVTINDSIVQGNSAWINPPINLTSRNGGGVGANMYGNLTLNDCLVIGNEAYGSGGGIYHDGSTIIVNNSVIGDNTAGNGGGISSGYYGQIEVNHSRVINNISTSPSDGGGGISSFNNILSLKDSEVSGNIAVGDGGGIEGQTMTIENSLISGNRAASGAGISGWYTTNIRNSAILSNQTAAGGGGGIYSRGDLVIINSTIAYNKVQGSSIYDANGGGIFRAGGYIQASNTTIAENEAQVAGGGIWNQSAPATLRNTILANNRALDGPDCVGTIISAGYNLLGNPSGCSFTSIAGDKVNIDPRFSFLYGWPYALALWPDSPAIDGGNPNGCTDHQSNPITEDQIGTIRPLDGNGDANALCDIGAYEYDPTHQPHWIFMPVIKR
jgi:hypothetical protein